MELFNADAKHGITGKLPTSTKPGVIVFGGHCGVGMLMATEVAKNRTSAYITTVSKRGRPAAPGPAAAFVSAMSSECVHYMAACDEKDTKALECLIDWAPASGDLYYEEVYEPTFEDIVEKVKQEIQSMSPTQLKGALRVTEDLKLTVIRSQREIKRRLQHKSFEQEKDRLQEVHLGLQEKETTILELVAELTGKLNSSQVSSDQGEPGVDRLLKRLERELELSKGF